MALDTRITVRLDNAVLKKLDDIRRKEPDLPARVEMMRRLLERASLHSEDPDETARRWEIDPKTLGDTEWVCAACGTIHDRDENAGSPRQQGPSHNKAD